MAKFRPLSREEPVFTRFWPVKLGPIKHEPKGPIGELPVNGARRLVFFMRGRRLGACAVGPLLVIEIDV